MDKKPDAASSSRLHVCVPFPIPLEWEVWRGADDGYASPACALWFAHDRIYDRVYVIAELYRAGTTPETFAREGLRHRSIPVDLGDAEVIENDMPLEGAIDSSSFADVGQGALIAIRKIIALMHCVTDSRGKLHGPESCE